MNDPQNIPHGLLYSIAPEHFSHLHINDNFLESDLDWDEGEHQCQGEYLASNVLEFFKELRSK